MTAIILGDRMLDEVIELGNLYDFYGSLLNDSQRRVVEMYYIEDFSLTEIAEELFVSKQAVHDNLKRAERNLKDLESKLHLMERFSKKEEKLEKILSWLEKLEKTCPENHEVQVISSEIKRLVSSLAETDVVEVID